MIELLKEFDTPKQSLKDYLDRNQEKFALTKDIFLNKSLHKWSTYLSWGTLHSLLRSHRLDVFTKLDKVNRRYFSHPKLIQLFNRYATYNGSSPYATPGIMSMIPHLEMNIGTYFPKGGMHEISQSLFRLATNVGVKFRFNEAVTAINYEGNHIKGVSTTKSAYLADVVVTNMDVFSTFTKLLPKATQPKRVLRQERSSSAIIFYWGLNKIFPELDLHNILFSNNYQLEFDRIFRDHEMTHGPDGVYQHYQ